MDMSFGFVNIGFKWSNCKIQRWFLRQFLIKLFGWQSTASFIVISMNLTSWYDLLYCCPLSWHQFSRHNLPNGLLILLFCIVIMSFKFSLTLISIYCRLMMMKKLPWLIFHKWYLYHTIMHRCMNFCLIFYGVSFLSMLG